MPRWNPSPMWQGEDVYVLGGGPSLRNFDWDSIRGKHVIGCNSNYILGHEIVEIVIFGDWMWWLKIGRKGTEGFGGLVVGCSPKTDERDPNCPWLLTMKRHTHTGLAPMGSGALGWHGNTGAMAVNLALTLGGKRVYLLGFDMKLSPEGRSNWHDLRYEKDNGGVYPRFVQDFRYVARDVSRKFPGSEVWNVTDDSNLDVFPKVSLAEHFQNKRKVS